MTVKATLAATTAKATNCITVVTNTTAPNRIRMGSRCSVGLNRLPKAKAHGAATAMRQSRAASRPISCVAPTRAFACVIVTVDPALTACTSKSTQACASDPSA